MTALWHDIDKEHLIRLWRCNVRDDEELARRIGKPVAAIRHKRVELGFLKDVA